MPVDIIELYFFVTITPRWHHPTLAVDLGYVGRGDWQSKLPGQP
jgi:hypothetical protein